MMVHTGCYACMYYYVEGKYMYTVCVYSYGIVPKEKEKERAADVVGVTVLDTFPSNQCRLQYALPLSRPPVMDQSSRRSGTWLADEFHSAGHYAYAPISR